MKKNHTLSHLFSLFAAAGLLAGLIFSVQPAWRTRADPLLPLVAAGIKPRAVAVNPVTNKVYVANEGSGTVTVIDGATNVTNTVTAGTSPYAVAVNPVTNKVYVANNVASGTVTVIDGATNGTSTVATGAGPNAVAVNPVTNKVYVANGGGSGSVTVIDGANHVIATIPIGSGSLPNAVAVNPATDKIYVANFYDGNVTVIDGSAPFTTTTVAADMFPNSVAVNPVTNKVYVANGGINILGTTVTVINGATSTVADTVTVGAETAPATVAVNPVTNKIYVANSISNTVTVIDGATNGASLVTVGLKPSAVAVNPVTNKIYVANPGDSVNPSTVTVIDGVTNGTTAVAAGISPGAVAVNPITGKVYVANYDSNDVTVIDGGTNGIATLPLSTAIQPLPSGSATLVATFTFTATSAYSPHALTPQNVYFQLDTLTGPWSTAAPAGGSTWSSGAVWLLQPGPHTLYAFATDGQEATSINTGQGSSPITGGVSEYPFVALQPARVYMPLVRR